MGSRERRDRQKQELRDLILDAARTMFVEEGFESFTMRRLAMRIEYSPTAIYLHFKDKESLIAELCRNDLALLTSSIHALTEPLPLRERLPTAAQAFVRFALAHPIQYRLLFMMPKPSPPPSAPTAGLEPDEAAYEFLRLHFAELIAAGCIKPAHAQPDMLAQVYFCGIHGVVAAAIAMGEYRLKAWHDAETQVLAFVDILCAAILVAPHQPEKRKSGDA